MEFNQRELNYLLTCLNYHYSEMDFKAPHIWNLMQSYVRNLISNGGYKKLNQTKLNLVVFRSISITLSFYFILLINTNTY